MTARPKHCRLGGSSAPIFTKCTKAPDLWVGRTRHPSSYTREGTLAHALSENFFHGVPPILDSVHVVEGQDVTVDADMVAGVQDFAALCKDTAQRCKWYVIEQNFDLAPLWTDVGLNPPEPLYGTTDFAGIEGPMLYVYDLKYGKGQGVSPVWNAQLMYYALGAYFRARTDRPDVADKITHVTLAIFAPRMQGYEEWVIELLDLLVWGEEVLKDAVDKISTGQGTYAVGKHCKFCVGASVCPALYAENVKIAQGAFPPLDEPLQPATQYLPPPIDLSEIELSNALEQAEMLNVWYQALRMETASRITRGREVPGWKLVAKKGYRQWLDPFAVFQALGNLGVRASEVSSKPEILSPAQVEKKLKLLGLDPRVIDVHVHTPTSGTTLVPMSHPSPSVNVSPSSPANFPDLGEDL